jgi:hypothetical protein
MNHESRSQEQGLRAARLRQRNAWQSFCEAMGTRELVASNVVVDPTPYTNAHGKAPRGAGVWAFGPHFATPVDSLDMFWTSGRTSYAEAKRQARRFFAARGVGVVYVQS